MRLFIILNAFLLIYIISTTHAKATSNETSAGFGKITSHDKTNYPKKVTSLKKRPTKTSTLYSTTTTTGTNYSLKSKPVNSKLKSKATEKEIAELADNFKNLPADDLEFIKELDKQFKMHGGKVKIKVERDNTTKTSAGGKNSKRTIEGDLGYGYAENGGYDYNPPKFMFYPYSQRDIPPTESSDDDAYYNQHYEPSKTGVTSVTIEPSYSYELKPQTSYESSHSGQPEVEPQIDLPQPDENTEHLLEEHGKEQVAESPHQQQGPGGYDEPVIVLRIPGPTKYATHLQHLLQQYLEIRAAQYLRILEEAEQRKQQHQQLVESEEPQQYEQTPQPAPEYGAPEHPTEEQQQYPEDVGYSHQLAPTHAPVSYPAIDDVYQSYKGRHQPEQQQQQQHHPHLYETPLQEQYYAPPQQHQAELNYQEVPQYYYMSQHQHHHHQQQQQQQQYVEADVNPAYQPHLYLIAMTPQQPQSIYSAPQHPQPIYTAPQHQPIYVPEEEAAHESSSSSHLPITENSPRSTHTKVIFTQHNQHGGSTADYTHNSYTLPSIRPQYLPSTQQQQHQQQHQQHYQTAAESNDAAEYQAQEQPQANVDTVSITQRPYNYHAHSLKTKRTRRQGFKLPVSASGVTKVMDTVNTKATSGETDHRLQQIREYVREKLGAELGSAVEYKTTQVLEG